MARLIKSFTLLTITSVLLSSCAVLSVSEADARWADYKDWTRINNKPITGDHTGFLGSLHKGPEGFRMVYVNDIGLATSQGKSPYKYPIGTVLVKEQYKNLQALNDGKKPALTIMVKVSNNAPNPGENWAWSRGYTKEAATDDVFCSGCHTIALANDFAFSNAESMTAFQ